MFVERNTQYTSFSSRKQPTNAGSERKQFTENASVPLQQTILTHAHTKCPPVGQTKLFSEIYIGTSAQQALVSKVSLVFQVYEGSGFLRVLLY